MKRPTKAEIRRQLDQQVDQYLKHGGEVKQVQRGESGLDNGRYDERTLAFEKPREERTPVDEVLQAIDKRRQEQKAPKKPAGSRTRSKRPRKKIIYDDFGEPLRVVWVDE